MATVAPAAAMHRATQQYDEGDPRRAAAAGVRAPSLHNSQPWVFVLRGGAIEVRSIPGARSEPDGPAGPAAPPPTTPGRRSRLPGYGTPGHPTPRREAAGVIAIADPHPVGGP